MKTNSTWLLKTIRILLIVIWYVNILLIIIGFTVLTLRPLNLKFGTGRFNDFSDMSIPVKYKANNAAIKMAPLTPDATHITIQEDQHLLKFKQKTTWGDVALSFFFFVALEVLLMTIIYQLRKFFNTIEQNSPFRYENVRRLKMIALCFALLTVLHVLLGISTHFTIAHTVKDMSNIDMVWSVNFTCLILGAVIYVMADVFKYGFNLQQENEEFV